MKSIWEWADYVMEFVFTNEWYVMLGCVFLTQTLVHSIAMIVLRAVMALTDHFMTEKMAMITCFGILGAIVVVFYKYIFWIALFEMFYVAYFLRGISWITLGEDIFTMKK